MNLIPSTYRVSQNWIPENKIKKWIKDDNSEITYNIFVWKKLTRSYQNIKNLILKEPLAIELQDFVNKIQTYKICEQFELYTEKTENLFAGVGQENREKAKMILDFILGADVQNYREFSEQLNK